MTLALLFNQGGGPAPVVPVVSTALASTPVSVVIDWPKAGNFDAGSLTGATFSAVSGQTSTSYVIGADVDASDLAVGNRVQVFTSGSTPGTTPLDGPGTLSAWSAMWEAVPLGSPAGWTGGDGVWSRMHPSGTAALFTFGDTPIVDDQGAYDATGVTGVVQGAPLSNDYAPFLEAVGETFVPGDRVQVYQSDGTTLKHPGHYVVASVSDPPFAGYRNVSLTANLPSTPATGDLWRVVTGGRTTYFPNSSAVAWTNDGLELVSGIGNFIPNDGDTTWYWAGPMIVDGGKLYVFPSKQAPSGGTFTVVARGLMRFDWTDPTAAPVFEAKIADMDPAIGWGAAAVKVGSWVYIFGVRKDPGDFGHDVYVARTPAGTLSNAPSTWQFWGTAGGGSWITGASNLTSTTNLKVVIARGTSGGTGVENTISADVVSGVVTITSKLAGVFGSDVSVWEAPAPTGPYVRRTIGSAPYGSPLAADQTYLAMGHFTLPRLDNGNALVSVSRNRSGMSVGDYFPSTGDPNGAEWYRPMWLEAADATAGTVRRWPTLHTITGISAAFSGLRNVFVEPDFPVLLTPGDVLRVLTPNGNDITDRVRGAITASYGRETGISPMTSGRMALAADNRSKDYSPRNTASPLYPNVKPGRAALARRTVGATTYTLGLTRLDDQPINPDLDAKTVQLSMSDWLADFRRVKLSTPLYRGIMTGDAVNAVLDDIGWTGGRDIDRGATYLPQWWEEGTVAWDALQKLVAAEGAPALVTLDPDGQVVFRGRHHRLTRARSVTSQATWRGNGSVEPVMAKGTVVNEGVAFVVNDVSVSIDERVTAALARVWETEDLMSLSAGEVDTWLVQTSDPFHSARTPAAGTDFQLTSGSVTIRLSRTSGAATTITATAGSSGARISGMALRAYGVPVARTRKVERRDSSSANDYGERDLPSDMSPGWGTRHDVGAVASGAVAERAEPLPLFSARFVCGARDEAKLAALLALDLSDRVTVIEPESATNGDFFIESISHTYVSPTEHEITFGLEAVPPNTVPVFLLDGPTTTLGTAVLGR